uniref:C-X-C motif chemokine n=1 Tax=Gopherus agassizii TaxID=38772 RepID=A0A452IGK0_9SAUR
SNRTSQRIPGAWGLWWRWVPFRQEFGRCSCIDKGSDFIQQKALGKIEVIPKSSSCDHVEIIATLKPTGEQKCLNPNSKWVRKMVTTLIKKR